MESFDYFQTLWYKVLKSMVESMHDDTIKKIRVKKGRKSLPEKQTEGVPKYRTENFQSVSRNQ